MNRLLMLISLVLIAMLVVLVGVLIGIPNRVEDWRFLGEVVGIGLSISLLASIIIIWVFDNRDRKQQALFDERFERKLKAVLERPSANFGEQDGSSVWLQFLRGGLEQKALIGSLNKRDLTAESRPYMFVSPIGEPKVTHFDALVEAIETMAHDAQFLGASYGLEVDQELAGELDGLEEAVAEFRRDVGGVRPALAIALLNPETSFVLPNSFGQLIFQHTRKIYERIAKKQKGSLN